MLLFETSAKDPKESQNVDSIFMALACRLKAQKSLLYRDVEREDGRVRLTQETETKSNCPCWGAARVQGGIEGKSKTKIGRCQGTGGVRLEQVFWWQYPFLAEVLGYSRFLSQWRIEIKCKCMACPTDTITGLVLEDEDWNTGGELDRCNY